MFSRDLLEVTSPSRDSATHLKNTKAVAIYYDSAGEIIGGASMIVDFIPAQGQTEIGISADLTLENVAKTDVYVQLTREALLDLAK